MKEQTLQREIRESIKYFYPFCHYVKIPDPSKKDIHATSKRPYDAFYIYKNKFIAFEYKQIKEPKSFSFKNVENHQIYNLLEVNQTFNPGLIIINYRFNFNEKQRKKFDTDKSKYNFIIAFNVKHFLDLKYLYTNYYNKQSIPFDFIWNQYQKKTDLIIEWIKENDKWVWDIRKIITYLS